MAVAPIARLHPEGERMDYYSIGCAPAYERCAQLGDDGYPSRAWRECRALIGQLVRLHGEPPSGARLAIKSCLHDFGTYYYEVVCYFDPRDPEAERYASTCEDGLPEYWDDMACQEIKQAEEER
jgi:hypothetical protein